MILFLYFFHEFLMSFLSFWTCRVIPSLTDLFVTRDKDCANKLRNTKCISLTTIKTEWSKLCFCYQGPYHLNELPNSICECKSLKTFKETLQTVLFNLRVCNFFTILYITCNFNLLEDQRAQPYVCMPLTCLFLTLLWLKIPEM